MNLSAETINVLKNFSSINPNIVIKQGNTIKTISEAKNILATAVVKESFEQDIGIYDLNEFLSVYGMFEDPEVKFSDDGNSLVIAGSGGQSATYFLSDQSILTSPQKDINMPDIDVSFVLTESQISSLRRSAAAIGVTDVVITSGGVEGSVEVLVTDTKDKTSNNFKISVGGATYKEPNFSLIFNINNFKFITGDYQINISSKLISEFINTSSNLSYWVALEKSSTFGV
jgi:hypothetical protein